MIFYFRSFTESHAQTLHSSTSGIQAWWVVAKGGQHLKFMKASINSTHEVIGSIIKEHVNPSYVALRIFVCVGTCM